MSGLCDQQSFEATSVVCPGLLGSYAGAGRWCDPDCGTDQLLHVAGPASPALLGHLTSLSFVT